MLIFVCRKAHWLYEMISALSTVLIDYYHDYVYVVYAHDYVYTKCRSFIFMYALDALLIFLL